MTPTDLSDNWVDTTLYISWYDHEGIITTQGFDVAKHLSHYLALLFILQRFNHSNWGRCGHPCFDTTRHGQSGISTSLDTKIGEKAFSVDMTERGLVHKTLAIAGRASCVRTCHMKGGDLYTDPKYVIKSSWKEKTRQSEGKIMDTILEKAEGDPKIIDFLPVFIAHEVFPDISTSGIRDCLKINSSPREFVIVVMVKLDGRISDLRGDNLWYAFWDCFHCHYRLWKLGIHHRDISTGNLMYWKDKNGNVYGKLTDFDLSSIRGEPSNNKQRTGTLPFMALELLKPKNSITHKYGHDVESFFWVIIHIILSADEAHWRNCPMSNWGNLGKDTLWEKKTIYITAQSKDPEFQPVVTDLVTNFERFSGFRRSVRSLYLQHLDLLDLQTDQPNQPPENGSSHSSVDKVYKKVVSDSEMTLQQHPVKNRPDIGSDANVFPPLPIPRFEQSVVD
ncbi:hypothetical protein FRC20_006967 [Serendipita sp. 405]|nr:hypothetical protein FRC20_006967 [Serendipita sp. 405]